MRILVLPLDERPANNRYSRMLAEMAGVELVMPPEPLMSAFRTPAPLDGLADWLRQSAGGVDALIVSLDMLIYGGLIPSRTSFDSQEVVLARLDVLREIKQAHPNLPIHAFNLIARVPRWNDATEDPAYCAQFGVQLFKLSQSISRRKYSLVGSDSWKRGFDGLPPGVSEDFFRRRARNHQVNRAALAFAADGVFDLLVIGSDLTSEFSLSSDERKLLEERAEELALGDRLQFYPGTDEIAGTLLARIIQRGQGRAVSFQPVYLVEGLETAIPPFEDVPLQVALERQIATVGGVLAGADADVLLLINPPVSPRAEWVGDFPSDGETDDSRLATYDGAANAIRAALHQGRRVALADAAYANGASHNLMVCLDTAGVLTELTAFAAWNTAGNTIGSVIAAAVIAGSEANPQAADCFLARRLLEDWGYQTITRALARQMLQSESGATDSDMHDWALPIDPARLPDLTQWIAEGLERFAVTHKLGYRPVNVRLPWGRLFEVDFDLEKT